MPSNQVKELLAHVQKLENKMTEISTDLVWLKRILVGAAGLGFIEKAISWVVK